MNNLSVYKPAIIAACILGMLAVIIGAFGAHALKKVFDADTMNSFDTGVKYQFYHVFALGLAGVLYMAFPNSSIVMASWFFIIGIILFSGSIYLLSYLKSTQQIGLGKLGLITPIGGLFFVAGWLMLLIGVFNKK